MPQEFEYIVKMEPRFAALERIDVGAVANSVTEQWYNETLCEVDDHLVRLGVLRGEYHWHSHEDEDEFFYVVDGKLLIELEGHPTVELSLATGLDRAQGTAASADRSGSHDRPDDREGGSGAVGR